MTAISFDTLAFANKLKNAGVDPKAAEAQAEATAEILNDLTINQLATKQDIRDLEMKMYSFITRSLAFSVTILVGLQTLFHFIK